ncbi:MAG: hypothetical protein RSC93_01185 [Erysipelotrichaceae bacterium]
MKVKDVLKFAGGIDHARGLLARMKSYIDSKPPLKNCWYSKGGSDEKFIHPYKSTYSISYKHLKEVIAEYDKTKTT